MIENEVAKNPLPKRKAGRPKGSKNKKSVVTKPKDQVKYRKIEEITVNVPLIPIYWRVKKMTWLIRNIEQHLKTDPLYIAPKEYFSLLKQQQEAYDELEKEGMATNEQRASYRERVKSKRLAQDGNEVATSRVGAGERPSLDAGISAPNPLGR